MAKLAELVNPSLTHLCIVGDMAAWLTQAVASAIFRNVAKYRIINGAVDGVVRMGKALASPVRVRALEALRQRELCLCELVDLFGTAPSTMSRHMSLLANVGLVRSRRDSRWTYYSLPPERPDHVDRALDLLDLMTAADPVVREDAARARELACR